MHMDLSYISATYGFELLRPAIKGTKLHFKVIQAIIISPPLPFWFSFFFVGGIPSLCLPISVSFSFVLVLSLSLFF